MKVAARVIRRRTFRCSPRARGRAGARAASELLGLAERCLRPEFLLNCSPAARGRQRRAARLLLGLTVPLSYPDDARTGQTVVKADAVMVYQHADRNDPKEGAKNSAAIRNTDRPKPDRHPRGDYTNLRTRMPASAMAQPPEATEVACQVRAHNPPSANTSRSASNRNRKKINRKGTPMISRRFGRRSTARQTWDRRTGRKFLTSDSII